MDKQFAAMFLLLGLWIGYCIYILGALSETRDLVFNIIMKGV
jgi:hypothetical protein